MIAGGPEPAEVQNESQSLAVAERQLDKLKGVSGGELNIPDCLAVEGDRQVGGTDPAVAGVQPHHSDEQRRALGFEYQFCARVHGNPLVVRHGPGTKRETEEILVHLRRMDQIQKRRHFLCRRLQFA